MFKIFQEAYLASLGVVNLTYEKAREISNKLIEKGELAKKRQQKFVTGLLEEARDNTSELTEIIGKRMKYFAKKGRPVKEKSDQIINSLSNSVRRGKLISKKKLKEVIEEVINGGKEINESRKKLLAGEKEKVMKTDEEIIREALGILGVPTKEDLKEIKEKLDILIEEMKKKGD